MDERDQKRQLIDARPGGTGRLRAGVEVARGGVDGARAGADRVRLAVEDAGWFLREHVAWPVEDSLERLGRRGAIAVFGGGGVAVAGVVAALLVAGSAGGGGSSAGTTEAFVTPQRAPAAVAVIPAPRPKAKVAKPTGPTLHGAPPSFSTAPEGPTGGIAAGKALGGGQGGAAAGDGPAARGAASAGGSRGATEPGNAGGWNGANTSTGTGANATHAGTGPSNAGDATSGADDEAGATATSNDTPASTAKIGSTPEATASAQAQADALADDGSSAATASNAGADGAAGASTGGVIGSAAGGKGHELTGPPAPKAAKKVARRFAEAFVVYEVGGVDGKVRKEFGKTSTKQLSRSLLQRPPRLPASVKVPQAKVVNVVAGPSQGSTYTVSVSLLRVGTTSELRLEMERGVGNKWQVTNVLG